MPEDVIKEVENPTPDEKSQKEIENLKAEVERKEIERSNAVEELKTERKLLQETRAKIKPDVPEDEVSEKIKQALEAKERVEAEKSKELAIKKFVGENKEFHPDNDPGGIKQSALLREFNGFNTNKLSSQDEFLAVLSKAKTLLTPKKEDDVIIEADPNSPTPTPSPRLNIQSKLTPKEQQLLKQVGWDEERFLKLKQSQPDYIRELLKT